MQPESFSQPAKVCERNRVRYCKLSLYFHLGKSSRKRNSHVVFYLYILKKREQWIHRLEIDLFNIIKLKYLVCSENMK